MRTVLFSLLLVFVASTASAQWVRLSGGPVEGGGCIQALNKDTVWVTGYSVYRSSDGGATWDSVGIPGNWPDGFFGMQFINDSVGYLLPYSFRPPLLKTTDAGHTWSEINMHGLVSLQKIATAGSDSIWILTNATVTRSTDAGQTWESHELVDYVSCMTFSDSKKGHAFGRVVPLPDHSKPASAIYERSTDGGVTWDFHYVGISRDIFCVIAANDHTLIAAGDRMVARSTNAGLSWDTIPPSWLGQGGFYGGTFVDSLHGTLVGDAGLIAHTMDGGVSWQKQATDVGYALWSASFVDTNVGFVTGGDSGHGGILKTTNGGVSWVDISPGRRTNFTVDCYPSPARNETLVTYSLSKTEHVTITVVSTDGMTVRRVVPEEVQSAGPNSQRIDLSDMPSGVYTIVVRGDHSSGLAKVTVIR